MGLIKKTKEQQKVDAMQLRNEIFGASDMGGSGDNIENMKQIIESWLDDKFIHAKTRLTGNQIIALTLLKTLADKYKITCVKEIIDNFCRYKLSEGGQSSKELVDILRSRPEYLPEAGIMDKIKAFTK